MTLSDQLAKIAADMGEYDHRRRIIMEGAERLREQEAREEPITPPPSPRARKDKPPPLATCGLCGNEGPRFTINCPECGERW